MTGWTQQTAPSTRGLDQATVTLVEGDSFCISDRAGDIHPLTAQGLFDRDTRFLSGWRLLVNDEPTEPLDVIEQEPSAATLLARARPPGGRADSTLLVLRRRYVGRGMREDLVLRNVGTESAAARITVLVEADFAHIFAVKDDRVVTRGERRMRAAGGVLQVDFSWRGVRRGVVVTSDVPDAVADDAGLELDAVVPPRGTWQACLQVTPVMDDGPVRPHYRCGEPIELAAPARRLRRWRRDIPKVTSGHDGLNVAVATGQEDLGALRIFDPELPDRAVVAAGAPWFMTLFGRDSLLTSWMALLVAPELAAGTLATLAHHQGTRSEPLSEEEPGKIPHELRWGGSKPLGRGTAGLYYGSVDATPLFVMALGELHRWGAAPDVVRDLLPHADRALEWVVEFGDRDGDGFVEYLRATDQGLLNQGWKDSFDGISDADGRFPSGPVALCEVQGYVYAAYLARAELATAVGDAEGAARWAGAAARLKAAFNDAFWLPEQGTYAVGLDGRKQPLDSVTSNVGHCLWTGIVDGNRAAAVAERLVAPDMASGFGIRTLSAEMKAYNPVSYHNGSVWPHDTALAVAGLMRYGFVEAAQRMTVDLLDAAAHFGGRLPELFCGFGRDDFSAPVRYPTACSPQAWAAAAPLLLVRTMLRFEPRLPDGSLVIAPVVPDEIRSLLVEHVPLGTARLSMFAEGRRLEVSAPPPGVVVEAGPGEGPPRPR